MGETHSTADDIVYDLVSIQYHAMKGAYLYTKYADDAHEHDDVRAFIDQVCREDAERAQRAHELLGRITTRHHAGVG
ncbi:hypothetical protein [Dactylosporangium sp. CA-092794]|uniref:hypothetical protein n=1 Tax=Dactylosporangium sp. CA-092794 TaxID=3239929 RepID=UPI003D911655